MVLPKAVLLWQVSDSVLLLVQGLPKVWPLKRVRLPTPQVVEHMDHAPHSVHSPSTVVKNFGYAVIQRKISFQFQIYTKLPSI